MRVERKTVLGGATLKNLRSTSAHGSCASHAGNSTSAAALATVRLRNAFIAALFGVRRGLHERRLGIDLAACRLIDLLVMTVAVAVGDALFSRTNAAAGHTKILTFAGILDLGDLFDLGDDAADNFQVVAAALRAANARFAPSSPNPIGNQD